MKRERANIALTGFMAAGKTGVGRSLARSSGWTFVDLDAVIEADEGTSVREIFARRGEPYFREREKAALGHVLDGSGQVIALGGGAVVDPDSRARLRERALLIWLRVSPDAVLRRTRGDDARPLLWQSATAAPGGKPPAVDGNPVPTQDGASPASPAATEAAKLRRIEALLAQREPIYAEADVTVDTDDLTVEQVAQCIQRHLSMP